MVTTPQRRQSTRRMVYRRKTRNPTGDELKAPLAELVVPGRRQMTARADCGRTFARSYDHFDALLVGTEVGLLVNKPGKRWHWFKIVISSMARREVEGAASTITGHGHGSLPASGRCGPFWGDHREMSEIPNKTWT